MRIHLSNTAFAVLLLLLTGIAELCSCTSSSTSFGCIERERQALLHFKRSLTFYYVPLSYNKLSSWEGHDCCQWEGIACDNVTGHVVKLDLKDPCSSLFLDSETELESAIEAKYGYDCPRAAFAQHVSPSLSQLEHLSYLDLSRIQIEGGPIPTFLGSMQRLRYLSLAGSVSQLTNPSTLGNLTNLHALYLTALDTADDISWLAQLSSLQYLGMDRVDLSKAHDLFQVLNMLPSLVGIHLSDCGLGYLPILSHPINLTNVTRVQVLNLAGNDLKDPFLDAFQNMTSIRVLDISDSHLNSVPSWLAKLEKLAKLDLSGAFHNNPVFDPLRNMSSIKVLDLSFNNLTSLPLWFGEFNNLELSLRHSGFSGQLPYVLQNMTSIRYLDYSQNNVRSIPSWLGKFKNLVGLDLSENLFYGPIPYALRNLTSLKFLDLSSNSFTSLPLWLGELKSLVYLVLSENNFTSPEEGSLSTILSNMCHLKQFVLRESNVQGLALQSNENLSGCNSYDLELLDLSWNEFGGSLPSWLGQFKNLKYLRLFSNSFFGPIPSSLGNLTNLVELHLGSNILNGSIPHNLAQLVNLEYFDLSSNHFNGVIPQSLDQLVNLEHLSLSSNHFDGVIPQSLGQLVNLGYLGLSSNHLEGVIPQSLCQLVNLKYLHLSSNHFMGVIPQSLGLLKNLHVLDLSFNYLEGTFPDLKAWPQMMSLSSLDFSNNQITGSLPESLGDVMPKLWFLLLNNNLITGSLPSSLYKIRSLYSFDVSNNRLSGNIPSTLWNISSLMWLHLDNNNFHGKLPLSLTNVKGLIFLDLGENQLSGAIPSWNSSIFPYLQILRMRRNMFSGSIPSSLCQFVELKILDLADNNLVGPIPHCIGNIRGMTSEARITYSYAMTGWDNEDVRQVIKGRELDYIRILKYLVNLDLSNNSLFGSIPDGISSLSGLHGLNLSHNNLSGEIPKMIGDMKSLEFIDFSYNQLYGTIPRSMSALTGLAQLNLSYNNLSGPIPTENQFQVLNDPFSYTGNRYLCGAPLQTICPGNDAHQVPENEAGENDESDKVWFYFVIALGFATGFWGVIGVLLFKKNWRYVCFGHVDKAADKIYVAFVLTVAKIKNRLQ